MNRLVQVGSERAAILIVDSLILRRAGIVSFLTAWADDSGMQIVSINPVEALAHSGPFLVKLVLLLVGPRSIADGEPQDWIASLRAKYSDVPLVLFSERDQPDEVVAAFKAGACGFVPMSIAPSVAVEALRFILGGGSFFPPTALVQDVHVQNSVRVSVTTRTALIAEARKCDLTVRQQEVLARLRQGESNKVIARQLKLRESTIKVHIRQLMRKLGATNRTQAALSTEQSRRTRDGKPEAPERDGGQK